MTFADKILYLRRWWLAFLSLTVLAACCKNVRQVNGMDGFKSASKVGLQCPEEVPSQGPIAITVTVDADARTYWDNQGILAEALQILLVRRDRPGLLSVAKIGPAAMILPAPSLPGRPSEKDLSRDTSRVSQVEVYDVLAYGRQHKGAAEYFVFATFADAWTESVRLRVVDPLGPMAPEQRETDLMDVSPWKEPIPAAHGLVVRIGELGDHPAVFGGFRTSAPKSDRSEPFATIVLARLSPKGGMLQRQFRLTYSRDRNDVSGGFAVPLSALDSINPLAPGRYALFSFVGNESAAATVVQIP